MSACSAATFISYHSRLCLSTTFFIFLFLILLRFWYSPQRKRYLTRCFDKCQQSFTTFFTHLFYTLFYTIQPMHSHGLYQSTSWFYRQRYSTYRLCLLQLYNSYITVIYLKVSLLPEFRQPEFHRMMIRSPLQPPPAQPGTRTGMLPQEARPYTPAG